MCVCVCVCVCVRVCVCRGWCGDRGGGEGGVVSLAWVVARSWSRSICDYFSSSLSLYPFPPPLWPAPQVLMHMCLALGQYISFISFLSVIVSLSIGLFSLNKINITFSFPPRIIILITCEYVTRPPRVLQRRRRRQLFKITEASRKVNRDTETVIVWFFFLPYYPPLIIILITCEPVTSTPSFPRSARSTRILLDKPLPPPYLHILPHKPICLVLRTNCLVSPSVSSSTPLWDGKNSLKGWIAIEKETSFGDLGSLPIGAIL